jgi:MFS family permease
VAERHPACQRIGPIVQGSSLLGILAATPARRIWLAGVAVGVVRWLEMLAFALWGLAATGSPLVVATLALARLLPLLLLAVPLSALLEGRDRRRVMLAALAAMLTSSALMLVAALVDLLSLPLLLAAAFANGIFWTIEQPVRRTLFVETAGLERAGAAMGLETLSNQGTRLLGSVAGGGAVQFLGPPGVFAGTLLLYALALWGLARARPPDAGLGPAPRPRADGLFDGVRLVARDRLLLGTVLVTLVYNLWGFPFVALAPVLAERSLGLSALKTGLLVAMDGVGGLLAGLVIVRAARPAAFRRVFTLGCGLLMVGILLLSLAGSIALAAVALLLAGFGMAGFATMQTVIPLLAAPAALRLRVQGVVTMAIGVSPLGFLHAGWLGERLGPETALAVMGTSGLLALLLIAWRLPVMLAARPPAPEPRDPGSGAGRPGAGGG